MCPLRKGPFTRATKDNVLAQYALESSSLPIGISEYELSKLYPADFKSTMPTIEEIENQMGMPVTIMEEGKEGAGKLSERERTILKYCKKPRSAEEIMSKLGLSNQTRNRKRYIGTLIEQGLLAMTLPDTPRSTNQKYVAIKKG